MYAVKLGNRYYKKVRSYQNKVDSYENWSKEILDREDVKSLPSFGQDIIRIVMDKMKPSWLRKDILSIEKEQYLCETLTIDTASEQASCEHPYFKELSMMEELFTGIFKPFRIELEPKSYLMVDDDHIRPYYRYDVKICLLMPK